ncbi:unnamed protein product [Amoebophrya sp. A25]|nr:unnamed protein product [Amoebophrya sp. A25]|eukprot:GSA25T00010987001.1
MIYRDYHNLKDADLAGPASSDIVALAAQAASASGAGPSVMFQDEVTGFSFLTASGHTPASASASSTPTASNRASGGSQSAQTGGGNIFAGPRPVGGAASGGGVSPPAPPGGAPVAPPNQAQFANGRRFVLPVPARDEILRAHERNLQACLVLAIGTLIAWYGITQAVRQYKMTPRARALMRRFGFFEYAENGATKEEKARCMRLILSHSTKDLSSIIADLRHVPGQILCACMLVGAILITTVDFHLVNYSKVTDGTAFLDVVVNTLRKLSLLALVPILFLPLPKNTELWTMEPESWHPKQLTPAETRANIREKNVEAFAQCKFHTLAAMLSACLTPMNLLVLIMDFVEFGTGAPAFYKNGHPQADKKGSFRALMTGDNLQAASFNRPDICRVSTWTIYEPLKLWSNVLFCWIPSPWVWFAISVVRLVIVLLNCHTAQRVMFHMTRARVGHVATMKSFRAEICFFKTNLRDCVLAAIAGLFAPYASYDSYAYNYYVQHEKMKLTVESQRSSIGSFQVVRQPTEATGQFALDASSADPVPGMNLGGGGNNPAQGAPAEWVITGSRGRFAFLLRWNMIQNLITRTLILVIAAVALFCTVGPWLIRRLCMAWNDFNYTDEELVELFDKSWVPNEENLEKMILTEFADHMGGEGDVDAGTSEAGLASDDGRITGEENTTNTSTSPDHAGGASTSAGRARRQGEATPGQGAIGEDYDDAVTTPFVVRGASLRRRETSGRASGRSVISDDGAALDVMESENQANLLNRQTARRESQMSSRREQPRHF